MKPDLAEFIAGIENETKRNDCLALIELMAQASGYQPALHGKIVGFGMYHYKYASGREGDAVVTGFSPRAQNISIYIMPGFSDYAGQLQALGKHKTAKSCLYIKRLSDIDQGVLREIVSDSVQLMQRKYECREA